jgi:phosphoribosylaminoimidazole-succinocarboxamide synthase
MVICEGKTKRIVKSENEGEVIIETKDDLTGGDAAKLETIEGISAHKTKQTTDVFTLLQKNNIETAFVKRISDNSFICHDCDMLPLELVMRRFAWGSYLKREPNLVSTIENPHRFDEIKTEFFHKHAVVVPPLTSKPIQMPEGDARAKYLKNGVWEKGVYTDPLLIPSTDKWSLFSAKVEVDPNNPLLDIEPVLSESEVKDLIEGIMIPTFSILEKAWSDIETGSGPVSLVDMKIEVGRSKKTGKIVLADVIDNDSWRIWPGADPSKQLDKQCFREDHPLNEVAENYQLVAELTGQF